MSTTDKMTLSRRQFMGLSGAFVLGMYLPVGRMARAANAKTSALNAFLVIAPDNTITFYNPFIEMGQGTYTSIPSIVAEELDAELGNMIIEQAPHGDEYKIMFNNTVRFTGGSLSVRSSYETMRQAGATARSMLISAAAEQWQVKPADCDTKPGMVVNKQTGKTLSYGELASLAAKQTVPERVKLKDPEDFRLIGKPVKRTDSLAKATGTANFGIDTQVEGMLIAVVRQSPVFGGKVKSFDANSVKNMPGVKWVDAIPDGVAVIADNFWHAKKAVEKLDVKFDEGSNASFSSSAYLQSLLSKLDDAGVTAEQEGDVDSALKNAAKTVTADYHVPFLAHATLEPMNCTALVTENHCTVWAPNQGADFVAGTAAKITGLPLDAIEVNTPFLGGGFGRRFLMDFTAQAVTLAKAHKGTPIKVVWTREEDTQHDFYRPLTAARYRAGLDENGMPVALHMTNAGEGPMGRLNPEFLQDPKIDTTIIEGAEKQPYHIPNKRLDIVHVPLSPVPIGYWRSVAHSVNGFIKESFIDELAHAAGQDPVNYRLAMLKNSPRYAAVLKKVAKMANWTAKVRQKDGVKHAMGVALHESFGSLVAQIAEVSISSNKPKVHKVWCVVDCGFAVNPGIIKMQIESAMAYGLSAALAEEVTMEKGRVTNTNFNTYPILAGKDMPEVETEIINSGAQMGGVGEIGTPPIAPAVCNALFSLTGKRIRSLPLSNADLTT